MMSMLLALAYPFCCMVVLYVAVLLAMIINSIDGSRWVRFQKSAKGWRFRCLVRVDRTIVFFVLSFRAMAPVFRCYWIVNF